MRLLWIVVFLAFARDSAGQETMIYYSDSEIPAGYRDDYFSGFHPKNLAEDLSLLLCCATGKKSRSAPFSGEKKGIFLLIDTHLRDSTNETGHVSIEKGVVTIRAKNAAGLSYAMYSWLQDLGFRFYLPGDTWMQVPDIKGGFADLKKTYRPHFKLRMFNASGGSFAVPGLDDSGLVKKEWNTWYRRNRMGSDYLRIDGHKGELFNIVHKKEIESDARILAPIDGKRKYDVTAKLDPTYEKGINMYTSWLVEEFANQQASIPQYLPFKKYQSADMGDGLNYCHTPECADRFESVSDQSFYIVNKAARQISSRFPEAGVSTLAYTERTDTPSFRIEPNVHVMVTPGAFQHVSIPSELMQRWAIKHNNISQYDFLNIGVWHFDHPFFDLEQYHSHLEWLRHLKVDGISFETSQSSMASGLPQYLLLQYLANPYDDINAEFDQWCKHLFGKASEPVKHLFRKWLFSEAHLKTSLEKHSFYPDEVAEFIFLMRQAENTKGLSDIEKERLLALKAYIVYLCGFYDLYQEPKSASSDASHMSDLKAEALLQFTWGLYYQRIFHNTQLNDLLKKATKNPADWDFRKGPLVKKTKPLRKEAIEKSFSSYEDKYGIFYKPPIELTKGDFDYLSRRAADSIRIRTTDEKAFKSFAYPIKLYARKPGKVKIKYAVGEGEKNNSYAVCLLALEEKGGKLLDKFFIYKTGSEGFVEFIIPAAGDYTIQLAQFYSTPATWIIFPQGNLLYVEKKSLIHHAIKLTDEKAGGYQNFQLAVWNNKKSFGFQPVFENVKNTVSFHSAEGRPLQINAGRRNNFYTVTIADTREPYSFYRNEVFRWPAVMQGIPPYFFFLQPGNAE